MEDKDSSDYYKILECDRTASTEELKRNYQRLVLTSHPDKIKSETDTFHLIQRAWKVLRDPESRKQYDAELICQDHNNLLLYDTLSLSEMERQSEDVYTYNCRCGGTYMLEANAYRTSKVVIACDECSFSIQVNL